MKQCSRIILQAADGSEFYSIPWDATTAVALLAGGALTVRQGDKAYAFRGATTPPAFSEPPVLVTVDPSPALAALKASMAAMPQATDQNAAFAALKVAVGAVSTAVVKQDPAPALTAIQAALKPPAAGSLGQIALTQTDGTGGFVIPLWVQTAPADTPPTINYNGVNLTLGTVKLLTPAA